MFVYCLDIALYFTMKTNADLRIKASFKAEIELKLQELSDIFRNAAAICFLVDERVHERSSMTL